MKTILMTAILMSVCFGINHSLKANTVSIVMTSISVQNTLSAASTVQSSSQQLKQELAQPVNTVTHGVKQISSAVVDLIASVIAYAFGSVGQVLTSISLD